MFGNSLRLLSMKLIVPVASLAMIVTAVLSLIAAIRG